MIAPERLVKIVTILLIGALTTACGVSAATKATTDSAALPSKTITQSITVTVTETVTKGVAVNPVRIDATCGSSVVHYGKLPAAARSGGIPSIPWIGSPGNAVVGALFYYGTPPFDTGPARAVIGTRGRSGAGAATKILWWTRDDTSRLSITGHRLDGPGSFATSVPPAGGDGGTVGTQFPSIVEIPRSGCWQIDLKGGTSTGSVTVQAYDVTR
jgi:hypothetical protein